MRPSSGQLDVVYSVHRALMIQVLSVCIHYMIYPTVIGSYLFALIAFIMNSMGV